MRILELSLSIIVFSLLLPQVSAYYEVTQGDTIYLGETVDISRVLSFNSQFAYWKSGYVGSEIPDKIIEVKGKTYAYYIDPKIYDKGTYYKWEGVIERNGNMLAFYVKEGKRNVTPVNITPTPTPQTVRKPTDPASVVPKDKHILLARGDDGILRYGLDNSSSSNPKQDAYLWLFGDGGVLTKIIGEKMPFDPKELGNTYLFEPNDTEHFGIGEYTGYIQYTGKNGRQDVIYDPVNNNLDSPYKGVKPVNLNSFIPERILEEFKNMSKPSEYCDDVLIPITMEVREPELVINNYWEQSDDIFISGTTTMGADTDIKVAIDPEHYVTYEEKFENTYITTAQGMSKEMRKFSITIPLKWGEMGIGHHKIHATIEKYKIDTFIDVDFLVSGEWVKPTPTQIFRKVIVSEGGESHIVDEENNTIDLQPTQPTPTPTPTPRPTPVPTPIPTKLPPTPVPKPTDDLTIPLTPLIAVGAVIIVGTILIRKR